MMIIWLNVQSFCIFATWLSIPFLPRQHGDLSRRPPRPNDGGVGKLGHGLRGTKRPLTEEKKGTSLKAFFAKQRREGGGGFQADPSDGAAHSSSRERPDGHPISDELCDVHLHQQGGNAGHQYFRRVRIGNKLKRTAW